MKANILKEHLAQVVSTLGNLGVSNIEEKRVLDLGCGAGETVKNLIDIGIDAYGCDMTEGATMMKDTVFPIGAFNGEEKLKVISQSPYRLPFADNFFDIVISNTVFEHVQDYDLTLSEISRILKPNGCCLHIFPPRWSPIELHVLMPLCGVIQNKLWISLWAQLGIRNQYQKGMSAKEVTKLNMNYLSSSTNYLSSKEIEWNFRKNFSEFIFCEKEFLKTRSKKAQFFLRIPFGDRLYRSLKMRVVFAANPITR